MLEILFCAIFTIFPDYLYRRYVQGKKIGREIKLYTVWYELRWGITTCLVLTISLITMIFYFHPSTQNVTFPYRTVTILPEISGRVAEVHVKLNDEVAAGAPLFRLDSSQQEAALEAARRRIDEIDAEAAVAQTELAAADGLIQQAQGSYQMALDELATKKELQRRSPGTVAAREIERLQVTVDGRQGAVTAAAANKQTLETRIATLIPAQKASAGAALKQAQVELDKTTVYASVAGRVQQFFLRPGDIVNPMLRSAGVLVPDTAGRVALVAGFNQIEAGVMKVGMIGEVTCAAKPFTIIPVVVTVVQGVIAAGQIRGTDQLIDVQDVPQTGTITVYMESLYPGQFEGIPPGSNCIANAYTSNEERLATEDLGTPTRLFLHAVDAVGMVHAMILRLQAILLPVTTLVLGGH
jgi:multidrug resistance efflux pump